MVENQGQKHFLGATHMASSLWDPGCTIKNIRMRKVEKIAFRNATLEDSKMAARVKSWRDAGDTLCRHNH
jgi:hypothetical protein